MKKLAVYPYSPIYDFFITYSYMLQEYDQLLFVFVNSVESMRGDHYLITNHLDSALVEADDIMLLEGCCNAESYNKIILESKEKKIFAERQVWRMIDQNLAAHVIKLSERPAAPPIENKLYDIEIPVISVMSMGLNAGKFALQLSLREYFIKQNYKVLQYGSSSISDMFGFSSLPEFLFENISLVNKILLLNQMIYKEAADRDADLIIIGAPGGILPYNKYVHSYFGEIPLILSKALQIDINVISTYFMENAENNIDKLLDALHPYCRESFGCEINIFNFSNMMMNYNHEKRKEEFYILNKEKVIRNCPASTNHIVFCDYYDINKANTFSYIENKLNSGFEQI